MLIVDGVPDFDPGAQRWRGHAQPGTYLRPKLPQGCPESRAASWRGRSPTRVAEMPRDAGPGGGRLALQVRSGSPAERSLLAYAATRQLHRLKATVGGGARRGHQVCPRRPRGRPCPPPSPTPAPPSPRARRPRTAVTTCVAGARVTAPNIYPPLSPATLTTRPTDVSMSTYG